MSTDATRAADQAAEAMRALNYATLPAEGAPGLEYPGDVYEVIASLKIMAQREQQALEQCVAWLRQAHAAGRIGHDQRIDPRRDVVATAAALMDAIGMLTSVERALNDAHNAAAHLTGVEP